MEKSRATVDDIVTRPGFDPNQQGAGFWYEAYCREHQHLNEMEQTLTALQKELSEIKEKLEKRGKRTSKTSSQPPSSDGFKKKSKPKDFLKPATGKKRGPKYGHPRTTRNGFEYVDRSKTLVVDRCPESGGAVHVVDEITPKVHQVAELVESWSTLGSIATPCTSVRSVDGEGMRRCRWGYRRISAMGAS